MVPTTDRSGAPDFLRLYGLRPRRRAGVSAVREAVMQTLRAQTKRVHGLPNSGSLHPGMLIVVQRFRSDLGSYVHLHALVTDGCFEAPAMANKAVVFRPAAGLCEQDLLRTLRRLHGDLNEHLEAPGE